jgi:hypothetical protein
LLASSLGQRREEEKDQRPARRKTPGVAERDSAQQAAAREEDLGRREDENNQCCSRSKTPGVVECESALQVAAREEPAVQQRESRQRVVARLNMTFDSRESRCASDADNQRLRCTDCGRREEENNQ